MAQHCRGSQLYLKGKHDLVRHLICSEIFISKRSEKGGHPLHKIYFFLEKVASPKVRTNTINCTRMKKLYSIC